MTVVYHTVGCAKCGEYHAFRQIDEADVALALLRARDPPGHDHDGLGVVTTDNPFGPNAR